MLPLGAVATVVGTMAMYSVRLAPSAWTKITSLVASLGYAIPGSVVAVGVLIPFGWLDNTIDGWARWTFGVSTGLILTGTIAALVYAYVVRFLSISRGAAEAGLTKITPSTVSTAWK